MVKGHHNPSYQVLQHPQGPRATNNQTSAPRWVQKEKKAYIPV